MNCYTCCLLTFINRNLFIRIIFFLKHLTGSVAPARSEYYLDRLRKLVVNLSRVLVQPHRSDCKMAQLSKRIVPAFLALAKERAH